MFAYVKDLLASILGNQASELLNNVEQIANPEQLSQGIEQLQTDLSAELSAELENMTGLPLDRPQ